MDSNNQTDKIDDVMLPGFRFRPTDEELVGFYLKRKIQQRPLPIELIKQVDIYKYDPWDLPNLASTVEKESYFYCPRDRKYRNSARPNRVTGTGFWKATGTDRPIYSSEGSKCIGLKKSLVFYRGRAAKGLKTDWMMHEFRLPSISGAVADKKILDKNFPPHDSWAICRIFKKASTMSQRAISHSWGSSLPVNTTSDMFTQDSHATPQLTSENMSCMTETGSVVQLYNELQQHSTATFSAHDNPTYRSMDPTIYKPFLLGGANGDFHNGLVFSSPDFSEPITKHTVDIGIMLPNPSPILIGNVKTTDFKNSHQDFDKTSMSSPGEMKGVDVGFTKNCNSTYSNNEWARVQSIGFPFSFPSCLPDEWKLDLEWDSPPCPSEVSPTYSNNNSYAQLN